MHSREQMTPSPSFAGIDSVAEPSAACRIYVPEAVGICHIQARRARGTELAAVAAVNDIVLPGEPKMLLSGSVMIVGIGPNAWLALEPGASFSLHRRMRDTLGSAATTTDQSDAYAVLGITGPSARTILAKGIALDLDEAVFLPGAAAVTRVAHMTVTMWRLEDEGEDPAFMLAVPRSYASSFLHWLRESAAEFRSIP